MSFGISGTAPIARRTQYQVKYNSVDVGLCDDVDPTGLKLVYEDITTGSTGKKNVLGRRLVGIAGSVKVQLRQVNAAQYAAMAPWSTGSPIQLAPPLNADMYQYSKPLVLHPLDMADATEDIVLPNACPTMLPLPKRTGGADDVLDIEFDVYPPRAPMATAPLQIYPGTIGASGG